MLGGECVAAHRDLSEAGCSKEEQYRLRFAMHLIVRGEGPEAEIMAGSSFEHYMCSNWCLLTYIVTSSQHRRKGLARKLIDGIRESVPGAPLVLEAHRSSTPDPTMDSGDRLVAYSRMGFCGVRGLPYVAPAVSEEHGNAVGLLLLVHGSAVRDGGIDADDLASFIREYWAACYARDVAPLVEMLRYCRSAGGSVPVTSAAEC
eukprot:TRINITY_DN24167_c0_g1_i2.p1 TRINITY_DN24167_c0_g1~~TRINITY_DN24167_c0_g1_i2.p1  ORF type:complete len:203 (+),score=30.18 TRINITY_DN24167_c0_g1_i2:188-796(+)